MDWNRPWAVEPLPDGECSSPRRPGRLRMVTAAGALGQPIAGLPAVDARGQGGLLDVALSPASTPTRRSSGATPSRDKAAMAPVWRAACYRPTGKAWIKCGDLRGCQPTTARSTSARGSPSVRTACCTSRWANVRTRRSVNTRNSSRVTWEDPGGSRRTVPHPTDNPFVGEGWRTARDLDTRSSQHAVRRLR